MFMYKSGQLDQLQKQFAIREDKKQSMNCNLRSDHEPPLHQKTETWLHGEIEGCNPVSNKLIYISNQLNECQVVIPMNA